MNSIDPNYTNSQCYLRTRVPTHSIGKPRIHLMYVAEIATAIAVLTLLAIIGPAVGFIATGVGLAFYKNRRKAIYNPHEKDIYLVWDGYSKGLTKRDFQIFIHPHLVKSKLKRANGFAEESEILLKNKNFEHHTYQSISSWTPQHQAVKLISNEQEKRFSIKTFALESSWIAQTQGRRDHMEDIVLGSNFNVKMGEKSYYIKMLGVLDGHNGIPNLTVEHLQYTLTECLEIHNAIDYTETGTFNALKLLAVKLHTMVHSRIGSTCVLALQMDKRIWIANSGDSRAFIVKKDGTTKTLTVDAHVQGSAHSSNENKYLDMNFVGPSLIHGAILDCNNLYTPSGSGLAMLRSLGDHHFIGKTARPKITYHDLSGDERFLVMISDGIADVGRNHEVGSFIDKLYTKNNNLQAIAAKTVEMALVRGSRDNLTCLVKSLESDINISNEKA